VWVIRVTDERPGGQSSSWPRNTAGLLAASVAGSVALAGAVLAAGHWIAARIRSAEERHAAELRAAQAARESHELTLEYTADAFRNRECALPLPPSPSPSGVGGSNRRVCRPTSLCAQRCTR
jgi:hypothetical protein